MLVSDGSMDGTKAASAAKLGGRVVHPDQFLDLLDHLQPAAQATGEPLDLIGGFPQDN